MVRCRPDCRYAYILARVKTGLMLVCLRCGHSWLRRSLAQNTGCLPRSAASPYWNRPEGRVLAAVGDGAMLVDQSRPHRYYPVAVLARLSPRSVGTVEAFVMSFLKAWADPSSDVFRWVEIGRDSPPPFVSAE